MPKVTQTEAYTAVAGRISNATLRDLFGEEVYAKAFGKDPASIDLLYAIQKDLVERIEHMKLSRSNR